MVVSVVLGMKTVRHKNLLIFMRTKPINSITFMLAWFFASLVPTIEYTAIIVAFLTGVMGPVILTVMRHFLNKKKNEFEKRKKDFVHTIETQKIINETLNSLQNKFNLDRIWLAQFHNGGNYYPGNKGMKKMSVSFESTSPGISADIMKMQNLPVSFFSSVLQKLSEGQESYTVDVDTEEDYALKSFWSNRGINSAYLFPIVCIQGGFMGILGVDFVKREGILNDASYSEIKRTTHLLSGYVATISYEENK